MIRGAPPARYPIRAVSRLTGISIDTLRAWERRHGVVTPIRDDRGRMYTDADVARLRLLRSALQQGHSIGRLARLGDPELREISESGAATAGTAGVSPGQSPALDASALDTAVRMFDMVGIDREIARLAGSLRPIDLLHTVLMPLLVRVGNDWHRGHLSVAHEHLISSVIRSALGSFLRLYARPDPPARLLFATLSGDRHEIGTLGAAMLAAGSGLGAVYLGPDLPARNIVQSVQPAGAQVLVLGLTPGSSEKAAERNLRAIVRGLPPDVELWTGGRGAEPHASIISPRGLVFDDYTAYHQELVRIGGRTP